MDLRDNQINKNKSFRQSINHALDGLKNLVLTERNFRKHLCIAVSAVILGLILRLSINAWLWVVVAVFFVFSSEVLNTIIELIVDLLVRNRYDVAAKKVKDVAAAGVLLSALFAVLIGILIYIPAIMALF